MAALTEMAVQTLLLESQKPKYPAHFIASIGREDNPLMYQFAQAVNIQPSTMQTKIRAMVRYGFVGESNKCPLTWTSIGNLWNELYTVRNLGAAKKIYELILSVSLAIYAFKDSGQQFIINPAKGEMPLKFLLNRLNADGEISLQDFTNLVDGNTSRVGNNTPYWKTDLINSGLFEESNACLVRTEKYENLVRELQNFIPDTSLDDEDWQRIRGNPLIQISPFGNSIKEIFEKMIQEQPTEELALDEIYTFPLVNVISEKEEAVLPELDILSENPRFVSNARRVRSATWSIRVKKKYRYICAVPRCDVVGKIFVESAHIKPDSAVGEGTPHRSHMLNGICLCRHCHVAFDRGYFALTDSHQVITSQRLEEVANQNLKTVILASSGITIKNRSDNKMPLLEFIRYHRKNKFME